MTKVRSKLKNIRLISPRQHLERLIDEAVDIGKSLLKAERSHLWLIRQKNEVWTNTNTQIPPLKIHFGDGIIGKIARYYLCFLIQHL
jgi:hypothetical protein